MYLKSPARMFCNRLELNRVHDKQFSYKHSNLLEITSVRNINQKCFTARHISTTPRLCADKSTDSIISLVAESNLVYKIQNVLVQFHDFTGLSWWTTIIVTACSVRTAFVLPLAIHQHYIAAKLEEVHKSLDTTVKTEVTKLVNDLSQKNNWSSKKMSLEYKRMMRERRHEKILENNCHPAKTAVIVLIQAPVWISLSSALRNLVHMLPSQDVNAQLIFLQMKVSNFLWLSNLTTPDTFTIPICLAIVNLSLLQVNYLARKQQKGFGKIILNVLRCFSLYMAYISSTVPSAISLYWLSSSCYGLCQNIILTNPKVKKVLGIPITESTRKNPLAHSYKKVKNIVKFFKY